MRTDSRSHIVVGLGFGDEGKGSWVDHLVRLTGTRYVVRFNGGAQAAHHVVAPDGRMHCFRQFGSGTLVPGTSTILSRFMLLDPQSLLKEAEELEQLGVTRPLGAILVSENTPVITPFNRLLNRIMEIRRGHARHGSCGYGIGLTQRDVEELGERALYVRDFSSPRLLDKLHWLHSQRVVEAEQYAAVENASDRDDLARIDLEYYRNLYRFFATQVRVCSDAELAEIIRVEDTVFEGAQGVLLDQDFGFFPNVTRSRCTFSNAETLLAQAGMSGRITRVGLLRGYGTRHGAGPFVTEDEELALPACHNGLNPWQGRFRLGWFDAVAARYALAVCGGRIDTLAITNLDRMIRLPEVRIGVRYHNPDPRYFAADGSSIYVPGEINLAVLADRTRSMQGLRAEYESMPGWSTDAAAMHRYLDRLAELIGHDVHAYSASAENGKVYRG